MLLDYTNITGVWDSHVVIAIGVRDHTLALVRHVYSVRDKENVG
jgi:hypothetical protein